MASRPSGRLEALLQRIDPGWVGVALFALSLVVYVGSNPERDRLLRPLRLAGRRLPARARRDRLPGHRGAVPERLLPGRPAAGRTGLAQIPFPPLPAILLLPFVAVFGLGTNGAAVAAVLGAVNVVLCWVMLLGVTPRRSAALLGTLFYGFGTVAWYAAMLGTTWFLAHVVASTFLFLAIGVAVRADARGARAPGSMAVAADCAASSWPGCSSARPALARLTTLFGAPFFVFVGGGGTLAAARRGCRGGAPSSPCCCCCLYNVATTGHLFHPAYEHLYRVEYRPRPELVNPAWGIEDLRYIPQNVGVMLAWPPERPLLDDPACAGRPLDVGALLDRDCPLLRPDPLGMSILLTSPAYLLALPALLRSWRRRIVAGSALAVLSIALIDLMHFSQGWVQFGYRFSNDFAPFAVDPRDARHRQARRGLPSAWAWSPSRSPSTPGASTGA